MSYIKKIVIFILMTFFVFTVIMPLVNAQAPEGMETNDLITKPPSSVFDDWMQAIILQVNNPYMSINGTLKEIDPECGATPVLVKGRTMLPIRALIDQLGGELQ